MKMDVFGSRQIDFTEYYRNSPLLKAFVAGSVSGTFSTVLFQPLDLVKTRLQNPTISAIHSSGGGAGVVSNVGMVQTFSHIVRTEHLFGLWKGMVPSLARCVPGVGLYFSVMHCLTTHITDNGSAPGPLQAVAIGATARSFSGICLIPITVVKTRIESGCFPYRSMREALRLIYHTEGIRGLCSGLAATLVRDAPFSGLYLMFYTQTQQAIPPELYLDGELGALTQFSCGVTAGVLASLVTQPADVIKTKMQLFPGQFRSVAEVATYVYQKYGLRGYFKGLVPRMLRRTMMAAVAWTIYEQAMRKVGIK